ncbi:MAG: hypothetical protein ABI637_09870 [Gemmatimonadota bacterium]
MANREWQSALTGSRTVLDNELTPGVASARLPLELLIPTAR